MKHSPPRTNLGVTLNGEAYMEVLDCDFDLVMDPQAPKKRKTRHNTYTFDPMLGDAAILDESLRTGFSYTGNGTIDYLDL